MWVSQKVHPSETRLAKTLATLTVSRWDLQTVSQWGWQRVHPLALQSVKPWALPLD